MPEDENNWSGEDIAGAALNGMFHDRGDFERYSGNTEIINPSKKNKDEAAKIYLERLLGVPFTEGNVIKPLQNGDEIFSAMLAQINKASKNISLLTFVYWKGHIAKVFAESLAKKAEEGVKVRVLLDAFGARIMDKSLIEKMVSAGAEVRWFRPLGWRIWDSDNRSHRKILICDDLIGFTGGVGIAQEWEGDARNPNEWRDMHFEMRGPCLAGLSGAFWENWIEVEGKAVPFSPPFVSVFPEGNSCVQVIKSSSVSGGSDAAVLLLGLIEIAHERIELVTPYLVLDGAYLKSITDKAKTGVRIRLMIPGPHIDRRFENIEAERYFIPLMQAGVEIYRYMPTMLHTKLIIIDDNLIALGSMNLNRRSMRKDEEIAVVVNDRGFNKNLRERVEEDFKNAKKLHQEKYKSPPLYRRLLLKLLRPFRKQL